MERLIAIITLLLVSPIIVIFYLLVKLGSKGPFIFKQKRIGKDFKKFTIYKIRTMVDGAENLRKNLENKNEADTIVFKIRNDPRFTKIGKFLSHSGLDEILQLINVIKGEMSFVGPRPLPVNEAKKIPNIYRARFSVKPGITSLWIIRGAHNVSFNEWMKLDLEYVRKKSVFFDLFIFLMTIILIFKLMGSRFNFRFPN